MSTDWVVLESFASRVEAEIVRALLEDHRISCFVQADDLGGMRPELAFSRSVRVLVGAEDLAAARQVMSAALAGGEK